MFTELDLRLERLKIRGRWEWRSDAPRLCFVFFRQGQGRYIAQHITKEVAGGDVLVLNAGIKGAIQTTGPKELVGCCFYTYLEHLIAIFTLSEFCLLERLAAAFADPWLYAANTPLARKCLQLIEAVPPQLGVEHRCHLLKVLAVVMSEEHRKASGKSSHRPGNQLDHVLDQVSLNDIQSLSVQDLARKAGCSQRHLGRLFRDRFGFSLSNLKMRMRVLKALTMLQDPNAKVTNVAMECGFNNLGLFSSRFRSQFGLNPSQWRAQILSGPRLTPQSSQADGECPMRKGGLCPWHTMVHPGDDTETR